MLKLERHLPKGPGTDLCYESNLTSRFSDEDLKAIGEHCYAGYDRDQQSRDKWLQRTHAAMEMAMQVAHEKTFPWPDAANVMFPLVTIASLQFHSRAYPAMFSGPEIVKYRVPGVDTDGSLTAKANLVARYMSHQCLDLDESFEEQHDRLLINVPIVGCAFVKTKRNTARNINTSSLVLARDLVVDYYAKSINDAVRKTHLIPLYRNEVYERCEGGTFKDIREETWYTVPFAPPTLPQDALRQKAEGKAQPLEADESTPLLFGEQHTWLDLDGDGYAEPYIVTFELSTKHVVRIVARWERPEDMEFIGSKVLRINATEYFTKYGLIPAPDGSIYDIGFGVLLGPLNESVNTIVNQLIDAGTMSVAAGGFLARGVKIRGGAITFQPFGWQHVDTTGDDLRKGVFPLPVREPSQVLFALLQLLINYTQRISGSTDTMTGENPGQNTPASNMETMVQQGMQVYAAIFKRMWRAMRDEFRKGFVLNARHMPDSVPFGGAKVTRAMFLEDPSLLVPAADPNLVSESMKLQQAVAIKQSAQTTPGYDIPAVERNFLRTLRVDGIEVLYPGPDRVPPLKNPKQIVEELKLEAAKMKLESETRQFIAQLMEDHELNEAKIRELEAKAIEHMANAQGVETGHNIALLEAAIGALKAHNDAVTDRILALQQPKEKSDGK